MTKFDENFSLEKTLPVGFFYKLPEKIRQEFDDDIKNFLIKKYMNWIEHHNNIIKYYMKDISPEQFIYIRNIAPDFEYFIFYEAFIILQPVIEFIVEKNDLYKIYPEYLL